MALLSSRLMKRSVANFVRALAVFLLFVPAPIGVFGQAPEAAEEEEDPWTARFLAPAVVVLCVVAIGASASYYVVRIRGRYRIAE